MCCLIKSLTLKNSLQKPKKKLFSLQSTKMRSFFDQHGDFLPQPPYIKWETSNFHIVYNLFRFVAWCHLTSRCHSEPRMTSNWAAGPREACHKHQSQEWSSPNKWEASGKIWEAICVGNGGEKNLFRKFELLFVGIVRFFLWIMQKCTT